MLAFGGGGGGGAVKLIKEKIEEPLVVEVEVEQVAHQAGGPRGTTVHLVDGSAGTETTGGGGGGGGNNENQAFGGSGGSGGQAQGGPGGGSGGAGTNGAAIRRISGFSVSINNSGTIAGSTNATGVG